MPGIAYTLGLDASKGLAGLQAMRSAFSGFTGMVGKLGPLLGLAGGLGLVGGAAAGFKKAIDEAADMETMETSFSVLLGNLSAAKERMGELAKFAAATPFELPEIAAASRTLQTLTRGALATGAGLALVGDVASGTNQPFADLAVTIGRLYDGLQSGRPVGEAMARLQELGVISGETRGRIEALQASGKKGDQVWSVAAAALGRFSGMMNQQSATWTGMMSTLKDGINAAFREFGAPVMLALKPLLSEGIGLADRLAGAARSAGEQLAGGIAFMRDAFSQGQLSEILGLSLRAGFATATEWLADKLSDIFIKIGETSGEMFKGLAIVFEGLGERIGNAILKAATGIERDDTQANAKVQVGGFFMKQATSGGLGDFIRGVATEGEAAKEKLAGFWDAFNQRAEFAADALNGGLGEPPQAQPTLATAATAVQAQRIDPLSDRLAKIGGFIGGNGGVRGEKAAQDTARNTGLIARSQAELAKHFETFMRTTAPGGVF